MAGIEIIGLVLGAVPLLISGLEHYRDGVETVQDMVQYAEVVGAIVTSVSTSLAIYRQSCEALLQGLLLSPDLLNRLLSGPGAAAWQDQTLVPQLQKQFGSPGEYDVYVRTVGRLSARMHKLRTKLGLDDDFQPVWMDEQRVDADKLASFFGRGRSFFRAVKIGFQNKKYLELVAGIERDVACIKTLTKGAKTLEPIRAEKKFRDAARQWLVARECASRLFFALGSFWPDRCPCPMPHVASMRLDIVSTYCLGATGLEKQRFGLLFTFDREVDAASDTPWACKAIEIEPLAACASTTTTS